MKRYDIAVIGTGPAGLEAAINAKVRDKEVILLGEKNLSKKIGIAPRVENYLGFPSVKGTDLGAAFQKHLDAMDIEITEAIVKKIMPYGEYFSIDTSAGIIEADAVVLATGVAVAKTIPGEEEFLGNGVGYCATCDGPLYKGKTVAIAGDVKEAESDARYLAQLAEKVYYIPKYEGWDEKMDTESDGKIEVIPGKPTQVTGSDGDAFTKRVSHLCIKSGEDDVEIKVDGVFFFKAMIPAGDLIPGIKMAEADAAAIEVKKDMSTNIPGLFAAGDCTGKPYQYMKAAGEGLVAGQSAVAFLDTKK